MTTRNRRPAFTLMEMMIVLAIIVVIAAIMIPASLALTDRSFVPKGASLLENALALAKTRAVAERRPNGIRLIASDINKRQTLLPGNPAFAWYDQIQFIEDPGDYVEGFVWGLSTPANPSVVAQPYWNTSLPSPGVLPIGFDNIIVFGNQFSFTGMVDGAGTLLARTNINRNMLLFGPLTSNGWATGAHPAQKLSFKYIDNIIPNNPTSISSLSAFVQPGDKVEILGTGQIYTIVSIAATTSPTGNVRGADLTLGKNLTVPVLELDRPLSTDVLTPLNGRPNYRIIRQPRAVPAMQPVKLPQEVVIDLTPTRTNMVPSVPDVDVNNSIYMSGVSQGIGVTNITGLTVPAGAPPQLIAPFYVDIMFSPSGELIPTNQQFGSLSASATRGAFVTGSSDILVIWLHAYGDPNLWASRQPTAAQGNADNQALVAVHARTGMIGSYQVAVPTTYNDPLYFVRTGIGRKSSDTGP